MNPTPQSFKDQQAGRLCFHARLMLLVTDPAGQFEHLHPQTLMCCVCRHAGWGGFTPLHYAALHGNRALVDLFLSNGADPNLTCDAGQTAFHFGCRWGVVSVEQTCIKSRWCAFLFCIWFCITVCAVDSHKARKHLYHAPDDAVWSWSAPHRPAGENITASRSHWWQHVSGGKNTSQLNLMFLLCNCLAKHTQMLQACTKC